MSHTGDFDALREIPGYKAILKSVIKTQIQLLIEQLSDQTGEESIILTASINDGTLSHLGSNMGKGFFEGHEEIKSQFLGYCLKSLQRGSDRKRQRKLFQQDSDERLQDSYQQEPSATKRQKSQQSNSRRLSTFDNQISQYLPTAAPEYSQTYPHVTQFHPPVRQGSASTVAHGTSDSNSNDTIGTDADHVKTEPDSDGQVSFSSTPQDIRISSTHQTANRRDTKLSFTGLSGVSNLRVPVDSSQSDLAQPDSAATAVGVKIEPSCESETELEITGIELASEPSGYQGDSRQGVSLDTEYQMFEQEIQSGNQNRHHKQCGQSNIPCSGQTSIRSSDDHTLVSSAELSAFSYGLRGQPLKPDSRGQIVSLPTRGRKKKIKTNMNQLGPDIVQVLNGPVSNGNILNVADNTLNNLVFQCELCGKSYMSKKGLNRHMKKHDASCEFECKKCTQYFKTKEAYEKHLENKYLRKHVCPACGKAFMTNSTLSYHIMAKHTSDIEQDL